MLCVRLVRAVPIFQNIHKYKYEIINPTLCVEMIVHTVYAHTHAYALLINEGKGDWQVIYEQTVTKQVVVWFCDYTNNVWIVLIWFGYFQHFYLLFLVLFQEPEALIIHVLDRKAKDAAISQRIKFKENIRLSSLEASSILLNPFPILSRQPRKVQRGSEWNGKFPMSEASCYLHKKKLFLCVYVCVYMWVCELFPACMYMCVKSWKLSAHWVCDLKLNPHSITSTVSISLC